jgi:acylphosphatase
LSEIVTHLRIHGRVQKVGYRNWTEHTARRYGLKGWVRNRADGTVEAIFAGPADVVGAMISACRRGPPSADVTSIDERAGSTAELDMRKPGEEFSYLPTV